ncbi:MAG: Yip1 family protein [Pseudomonadota bacterium]
MIGHVTGLFLHPAKEWEAIRDTNEKTGYMPTLILALIPAASTYIGTTKIGWTVSSNPTVVLTESSALIMSTLMYFAILAGVVAMGIFVKWMSRTYDSSPSLARCIAFAAYTATPIFFAGFTMLYPAPVLIMLVGVGAIFYTIYFLYSGISIFMRIPEAEGFMFASSILTVGMVMLVSLITITVLILSLGFGSIYLFKG